MTKNVLDAASELDRQCASYILAMNMPKNDTGRALALVRMLPMLERRRRHLIKAISKFRQRSISEAVLSRDIDNWQVMSTYNTIRPFVIKHRPPASQEELATWKKEHLDRLYNEYWEGINAMKRKLPTGIKLPPIFTSGRSTLTERKASMSYLNRIPGSPALTAITPRLHNLLSHRYLKDDQADECEELLLQLT